MQIARKQWSLMTLMAAAALFALPVVAGAQNEMAILRATKAPMNSIWLDSLDISKLTSGWEGHDPQAGKSIEGNPLTLKGVVYPHGIGTHAISECVINLKGAATRFVALVGVDDEKATSAASVTFDIYVDGKKVASSGVIRGGQEPKLLSVDLTGAKKMVLQIGDADDGMDSDHADIGGALLFLKPGSSVKPELVTPPPIPVLPPRMVVPALDPKPAIHGPRITGATPGRPFLFMIPVTGESPFTYSASKLPAGLSLDSQTGIITGALAKEGSADVEITVKGAKGTAKRKLTIIGGDHKLAMTPPLGWNSWNCWAGAVDDDKVRAAADWMVKSGLAAHGFQYVNIDDTWEGTRNAAGEIQTNSKFPDMRATSDYVHGKGLKFGIYSSPGPKTCAGFEASYKFEDNDAMTYAKWGVDYLKYDWCSYSSVVTGIDERDKQRKPYSRMREALDKSNRDILYSLCQYGMDNVWEWGGDTPVYGNCWRTTGDINDSWGSLHGIYTKQNGHEKFAGPGHWNDPDMLVVGKVGWGPGLHESRLTPNEQLIHISMWCMLSSPLLIGCDMSRMSDFTISLLSNDEALDINQDPLGKPAGRISMTGELEAWSRPLYDGTMAVTLVNGGSEPAMMTVNWNDLKIQGKQPVRDLWLHKHVGSFDDKYSEIVPAHGCILLKIGKGNR